MNDATVLTKTARGLEEIETRKYKLDQRLRALLITVNGRSTVGEIAGKFASLGDVRPMLAQLAQQGYVMAGSGSANPAEKLNRARLELAREIVGALGPAGDAFAAKIEQAATVEDLKAYLETRRDAIGMALGRKADAFWQKAAALLA